MLKDLIVEMLTDVVPNPATIAEICTRSEKKVLVLRTHLLGSFVFVYSEKLDSLPIKKSDYPEFGYVYDYAKMFDDNNLKLLAMAAGSLERQDSQTWDQSLIWSIMPPASIVLFASMLKTWKRVRFREDLVVETLNGLVGKYSAQQAHLVAQQDVIKTYMVKPSMETIDTTNEIHMITSEFVAGEDRRHRNIHSLIVSHIDAVRGRLINETERIKNSIHAENVDLTKPIEFSPENLFKALRF